MISNSFSVRALDSPPGSKTYLRNSASTKNIFRYNQEIYTPLYTILQVSTLTIYAIILFTASLPGMWERTVTVGSSGKTFNATGYKVYS